MFSRIWGASAFRYCRERWTLTGLGAFVDDGEMATIPSGVNVRAAIVEARLRELYVTQGLPSTRSRRHSKSHLRRFSVDSRISVYRREPVDLYQARAAMRSHGLVGDSNGPRTLLTLSSSSTGSAPRRDGWLKSPVISAYEGLPLTATCGGCATRNGSRSRCSDGSTMRRTSRAFSASATGPRPSSSRATCRWAASGR
jgi:hypothetical protein